MPLDAQAQAPLLLFSTLPSGHRLILMQDDRHAPVFSAGEFLAVDVRQKEPLAGSFYAVTYGARLEVQQCRSWDLWPEAYLLGATNPAFRKNICADGLYDAASFKCFVAGRIVGIVRCRQE